MDELIALFAASNKKFNRMAKLMAAAMGAEVDWNEDEDGSQTTQSSTKYRAISDGHYAGAIVGANEVSQLPINLGYETI